MCHGADRRTAVDDDHDDDHRAAEGVDIDHDIDHDTGLDFDHDTGLDLDHDDGSEDLASDRRERTAGPGIGNDPDRRPGQAGLLTSRATGPELDRPIHGKLTDPVGSRARPGRSGREGMQTPAWAPGSVGSAYSRGSADQDDLLSGREWRRFLDALGRTGEVLQSGRPPSDAVDRAAGYRHLLVLLALGIDEALRSSDPYRPRFSPANVDNVLKWGMDCPDAAYTGARIRGDATYRVRGRRNSVRYLGFQVMGGMENTGNVVADDLEMDADGRFELVLSATRQPGNWMPLTPSSSSLVVRQFFCDWVGETPAELSIECVDRPPDANARTPAPLSPAGVANQIRALGEFVGASIDFWLDVEESGRKVGVNCFRPPAALTTMGAAAENVSTWGSWSLADEEALIIEVTPPAALYWSVSIGNYWWETVDYAERQSSLNGHQAVLDADGVFRAVLAHRDPGVANWLDTGGNHHGAMIFRWLRAESAPVPSTRTVSTAGVLGALPEGTVRVDAAQRRQILDERRAAVERRFPR